MNLDKSIRILVVDDMESMRNLIARNLSGMGFTHVLQASNGREALRTLEANPSIKVVLADWSMPVMSGLDLLRAIRAHPGLSRLPVMMITAEIGRQQVAEAVAAGISDFLIKPFSAGALQAKLDRIIANLRAGKVIGAAGEDLAGFENAAAGTLAAPSVRRPLEAEQPPVLVISDDLKASMAGKDSLLVVDDVPDNIDVLVGLLQDEFKVRAARSGESALKTLAVAAAAGQPLPDLILLDVMMPEMDGFEVCRRLKANPATAAIPVIFLTAAEDPASVTQGFEIGAADYVAKPANPAVLRARVRTHLTRSRAFAELQKRNQVMNENIRLREEVDRIMAHDLKNPIGGIINFTEMLLADEMMTRDQKELLETIDDSARSLLNMVNLSLDLFKIEQGTYQLQPTRIDLVALIRRLLMQKGPEIDARSLQVTVTLQQGGLLEGEGTFYVRGDELLCYSLFSNLIGNAVEASPDEGRLAIAYAQGGDGRCTIAITNSGTVPVGIRGSFFDKYVTVGKKDGTGLGTYSARLLTEVQQGAITMQTSDERNETTLTVTLPSAA